MELLGDKVIPCLTCGEMVIYNYLLVLIMPKFKNKTIILTVKADVPE